MQQGLGFRGLGFRVSGFRVLGLRRMEGVYLAMVTRLRKQQKLHTNLFTCFWCSPCCHSMDFPASAGNSVLLESTAPGVPKVYFLEVQGPK